MPLTIWVFLFLSLSFCHGKDSTVKVFGQIHCANCIRHEFSSNRASSGLRLFIHCEDSGKTDTSIQGSGPVDEEGKFNITLSAHNTTKDGYSIDNCFTKLEKCLLKTTQTASLEFHTTNHNTAQEAHNTSIILKFCPETCQSAFFTPKPKFIFPNTSQILSLPRQPVSMPHNPLVFQSPKKTPRNSKTESPSPSPIPIYNNPPHFPSPNEPISPPFLKQPPKTPPQNRESTHPPTKAFHQTPYLQNPIPPSYPPTSHKKPHLAAPTPIPVPKHQTTPTPSPSPGPNPSPYHHPPLSGPGSPIPPPPNRKKSYPSPLVAPGPHITPTHSKSPPTPAPAPISKPRKAIAPSPSQNPSPNHNPPPPEPENPTLPPPDRRKPDPIPRPPPVPQLPPIPPVPRKYFNPPNTNPSQPPQSSH
ncbi:Unknown protein [Striga hermonthica]|uniref:Uncharacterized protein n=1 Tax=Striga hermonthica TaxID=68872 RepID=A0A9N7QZX3_STRHE|nr:Unknown protein [Striga hermonthica]